ncbi:MAG: HPP family protein [Planctomycetota bacterium]
MVNEINEVTDAGARAGVRPAFVVFLKAAVAIGIIGFITKWSGNAMLMPPLGATAFLCCLKPDAPFASFRNITIGHTIGILCGGLATVALGVYGLPFAGHANMSIERILAIMLALGSTCGLMIYTDTPHAPAGATTLVVSMGSLTSWTQFAEFEAGVILLALFAVVNQRYLSK